MKWLTMRTVNDGKERQWTPQNVFHKEYEQELCNHILEIELID